jgi:hypothetical protein
MRKNEKQWKEWRKAWGKGKRKEKGCKENEHVNLTGQ